MLKFTLLTTSPLKCIYLFISILHLISKLKYGGGILLVQMTTLKILGFFNLGGFSLIAGFSYFFTKGPNRVQLLGWIGLCFGVGVFVAPLSIMVRVLLSRYATKSFYCLLPGRPQFSTVFLHRSDVELCCFAMQRTVIRTKSVEFMPFPLSFFLTLNAVAWFFYGFLKNDFYVYVSSIYISLKPYQLLNK